MADPLESRSESQCFILLVGRSGCGKSSTINHLFSLNSTSLTLETKEYILCEKNEESVLSVVDTPGYEDTRGGLQQDACNLKTIKTFFQSPNLKGKVPNVIYVLLPATDQRYEGDISHFSQTLKCLKSLRLVDPERPNVVGIITKCCSMRPDYQRFQEEWLHNINLMKDKVGRLIEDHVGVRCPVVILENRFDSENEDLDMVEEDSRHLSVLPNGELQPLNLFETSVEVMKRNGDCVGERCLTRSFRDVNEMFVKEGRSIVAKDALKDELDEDEEDLLKTLKTKFVIPREINQSSNTKLQTKLPLLRDNPSLITSLVVFCLILYTFGIIKLFLQRKDPISSNPIMRQISSPLNPWTSCPKSGNESYPNSLVNPLNMCILNGVTVYRKFEVQPNIMCSISDRDKCLMCDWDRFPLPRANETNVGLIMDWRSQFEYYSKEFCIFMACSASIDIVRQI